VWVEAARHPRANGASEPRANEGDPLKSRTEPHRHQPIIRITDSMAREVYLHVYDLSMGMARQLAPALLGVQIDIVPHTGVVLGATEYFYGGGIQALAPHQVVGAFA
jgi:hypothetical protein